MSLDVLVGYDRAHAQETGKECSLTPAGSAEWFPCPCTGALNQAGEILGLSKIGYHDALKRLASKAKAQGLQPKDSRIEDIFEVGKVTNIWKCAFFESLSHPEIRFSQVQDARS